MLGITHPNNEGDTRRCLGTTHPCKEGDTLRCLGTTHPNKERGARMGHTQMFWKYTS
jgi:hypothetical protein